MHFYFDEMVSRRVASGLIDRGHKVTMAVDAGMEGKDDFEHLLYATQKSMVMVTFDHPFAGRAMQRADHGGLVCISAKAQNEIGGLVRLLHNFASKYAPEEIVGRVFWLK